MKRKSLKLNAILSVLQRTSNIIFSMMTFPYLSRILGPENYGIVSFSNSVVQYFSLAAMLGINTYAVREGARIRDDKEKINIFSSEVWTINLLSTTASIVVLYIVVNLVPKFLQYKSIIYLLAISIPCAFLGRDWLNTIYEDYLYITIRYILIHLAGLIAIYTFIHKSEDYVVYAAIYTFISSFGYILNLWYTKRYVPFRFTLKLNFKKHIIPILILFCGQLAVNIYLQSDITILGLLLTQREVGIYSIASKTYLLSKSMINALTSTLIPRAVNLLGRKNTEQYTFFINKIILFLLTLVVPAGIGMAFFSKNILLIVGGSEYFEGESTLCILGFALIASVFSGLFCNAILIPNRAEKTYLMITVISAIVNIVLNLILIPLIGMAGAAVTTLISECFVMFIGYKKALTFVNFNLNKREVSNVLIGSLLVAIICFFCKQININLIYQLIIGILLSIAAYVATFVIRKSEIINDIIRF